MRTWLITGCSSGLGRDLAGAALARGLNVVATARNVGSIEDLARSCPERALPVRLDVTDPDGIARVIDQTRGRFGPVDVLVNNAGHGYRAAIEEGERDAVAELFATNFFGAVELIKAVLPDMRARREGTIVNVSSTAGRYAAVGSGYYAATKFALEGVSDALRKEVAPLGIRVIVVEPGAFRTEFAGRSLQQSAAAIADYAATAGRRRKENDPTHGTQPGDPARAAEALIAAIERDSAPFRLVLGTDALEGITAELNSQLGELQAWQHISTSTDFPDEH